jgi:general secretion pathway protein C
MVDIHLQQRMFFIASIVLIALLILTAFYSLWQWHSDWVLAHQEVELGPELIRKTDTDKLIASIADAHLFGRVAEKVLTEAPISSLQLKVTGIIKISHQNTGSRALISTAGQPGKVYKIGDTVANGVKIYDITADTVILENNGRLEKLPLVREKLQFKPRSKEGL